MLHFTAFGMEIFSTTISHYTLIRYFTGVGFENTWTTNMDYDYIIRNLDLKILGFRIWISMVIYGSGPENTWISNLDFDGYLWIWT